MAKFTHVCSYDRAEMGWSDYVRGEHSPQQVAGMLHDLLEKANEQPPFIMMGHSLGGIYIHTFASKYPGDVVGMVLVDSPHENQNQRFSPEFENLNNSQALPSSFAGLPRLLAWCGRST